MYYFALSMISYVLLCFILHLITFQFVLVGIARYHFVLVCTSMSS